MRRLTPKLSYYLTLLTLCLALSACEQNTYTTWACKNRVGDQLTMILKKAQMQFQDQALDYCGSLGIRSYFDLPCPALIQDASATFIPSTGALLVNDTTFQCDVL
jgi:hypothetical protein